MENRSVNELWWEYSAITMEMSKFLEKEELDTFFQLLEQRETLQAAIDRKPHDEFRLSPEGQELIGRIRREDQSITLKVQQWLNKARQQETISKAYDNHSHVGGKMDFTR